SPARRMTNGDGTAAGGSRHHREVSAPGLVSSNECAGCGKRITDRFLLKALDLFWHEDCLKCGCCDCRLGEVGSTLYTKANLILCKRDYLRLFGSTGFCAACSKSIPAFEMVMRARSNVYHLECFACQQCNHRFCVGDRFYLCENKILCEYDYEERMVFANMACSPGSLSLLRRQVSNFQQPGSGIQSEQPQQQPFSSSNTILSIVDQHDQHHHLQPKHPLHISKIPARQSNAIGIDFDSTPSPPSDQHCFETRYITPQPVVSDQSDHFLNDTQASFMTPSSSSKRPKLSYSTYTNDNLGVASNMEKNNNTYENLSKSFPFGTVSVITSVPRRGVSMLPEAHVHANSTSKLTIGNNTVGSPDSGIVE
ncbi:Rhombotin-1, partial [Orchesella cincta]